MTSHFTQNLTASTQPTGGLSAIHWYSGSFKFTSVPHNIRATTRILVLITIKRGSV